jgi:hypothetical protein
MSVAWFGVRLPRAGVRTFDVRCPEHEAGSVKAPWGETLWSGERATYAAGLKVGYCDHDTSMLSCSTYTDHRTCADAQNTKAVRDARKELARIWRDYRNAVRHPAREGDGGGVAYRPVVFHLGNYGWGLDGDTRHRAIWHFDRPHGCHRGCSS